MNFGLRIGVEQIRVLIVRLLNVLFLKFYRMENDAIKSRKEFWVQGDLRTFFVGFRKALVRPVDALPLDIFRVLMGVLLLAYFIRTFFEAGDFLVFVLPYQINETILFVSLFV